MTHHLPLGNYFEFPNLDLPFLAFYQKKKKARKTTKKTRIFLSSEPLKFLGKKRKTLNKAREFLANEKRKEIQTKTRIGRLGNLVVFFFLVDCNLYAEAPFCLGIRKGGGGGQNVSCDFGGGKTYHKAPPPKPVLEASESGICLVCARFL